MPRNARSRCAELSDRDARYAHAKGAVAAQLVAEIALLARMRDLDTELMKKLATKSRMRQPNEAMRRLQMELPLLCTAAANDAKPALAVEKKPRKRGAKKPMPHGRLLPPSHLPHVPNVLLVPAAKRTCPSCHVEVECICLKTTAEKLDVEASKFIVSQTQLETWACPQCHHYITLGGAKQLAMPCDGGHCDLAPVQA